MGWVLVALAAPDTTPAPAPSSRTVEWSPSTITFHRVRVIIEMIHLERDPQQAYAARRLREKTKNE